MRGDDQEGPIDQYYASLYRFALSLCGNETDASDLVQETCYLWITKGHQLSDISKVKSWLFTTLYRMFLGRKRRQTRFPHHELEEVAEELPEIPPEPPTHVDWESASACLARLDETFRAPVALFYLEDHAYGEIAEILGIPLGTVKSRISRGVALLQRMMIERSAPASPAGAEPA